MAYLDLQLDHLAIEDLADEPEVEALIWDVVDDIADVARSNAADDSDTGEGAASIHGEVHRGADPAAFPSTYQPEDEHPTGYVSWDQDHFYMGFPELGTEHQAPRPFLRPALDSAQI